MSQVFAADSVNAGIVSMPVSTNTTVITGNFLNPPFGNAKAAVTVTANITAGTGTTNIVFYVARNPLKENVNVNPSGFTVTMTPGSSTQICFTVADAIPDGRAVQYALIAYVSNGSAASSSNWSCVSVLLISG